MLSSIMNYLRDTRKKVQETITYTENVSIMTENFIGANTVRKLIEEKINKFCKMIEVNPKDWQIKILKNRWGSVTKNKKIVLNMNLIKTPEKIIDYIIIHELCHLKIEGHSHNFWNLLYKFVPDYNERIKWLELNSKNILIS